MHTFKLYEQYAEETAMYSTRDYPFIAMSEEVGEVLGKLAKYGRKNGCTMNHALEAARYGTAPELRADLKKELGDVLWQLAMAAKEIGYSLEVIAHDNIAKLQDRAARNVVDGEGDNR